MKYIKIVYGIVIVYVAFSTLLFVAGLTLTGLLAFVVWDISHWQALLFTLLRIALAGGIVATLFSLLSDWRGFKESIDVV